MSGADQWNEQLDQLTEARTVVAVWVGYAQRHPKLQLLDDDEGEVLREALTVLDALDYRLHAAAAPTDPDGSSYAIPLPDSLVPNYWPIGTLFQYKLQDDGRSFRLDAIPPDAPADDAPIYRLEQLEDGNLVLQPVPSWLTG